MEQKKTVLIVEDEKNIVDIIRFNLQRTGYNTLEDPCHSSLNDGIFDS